jgi:sugar lactone lactonase YvrE
MTNHLFRAFLFFLLIGITGMAASAEADIKFSDKELYPEGITFDVNADQFLVSSMRHGKIGRVGRDGVYHTFINDPILVSSVGMHIDPARNWLLVAVSDPGVAVSTKKETQAKLAGLAVYDIKSGKRLAYHDLGRLSEGGHFANDITVDAEGNIYVTDSFSPIVYRIGKQGKPSIFVQSDHFKGEGFNLNGIIYHHNGYLIVGKSNSGELFKISMKGDVSIIKIQQNFIGNDGLVLEQDGSLVVIQNSGEVSRLVSSDNWNSALMAGSVKSGLEFLTTGVVVGSSLYVLNAKLGELFDPKAKKGDNFSIHHIQF